MGEQHTLDATRPVQNFCVSSTTGQIKDVAFYLIESTAPDNVDPPPDKDVQNPPGLSPVATDIAVKEIVDRLVPPEEPADASLVVMVHGFNTPRSRALDFYKDALEALVGDKTAIFGDDRRRIVCIAYRWPSESVGSVLSSSGSAMPLLLSWLFVGAAIVLVADAVGWIAADFHWAAYWPAWLFTLGAVALVAMIVILLLLRAIVYFRDVYRATNYGVPDLVEVIRQIDRAASKAADALARQDGRPRKRIALSFIGHSMGGLVVTNAIRVLSDVFDPDVILTTLSGENRRERGAQAATDQVPGRLGHVFSLERFVLASPDIPAETLLSARANFLASSLRRFNEAYLLSNEGDEVLLMISTIVNYFTFPTRSRNYGYRLGNIEILSEGFGTIASHGLLSNLRVGDRTLAKLSQEKTREGAADPTEVAEAFTYFDCTDYVDEPGRHGYLSEALNVKAHDPERSMSYWQHMRLLVRYLLPGKLHIDVHGGYFKGDLTRQLIYRLSCLGAAGAEAAFGGEAAMLAACKDHQIRVMLSERLRTRNRRPPEAMDLSEAAA
jgi:hypothetical protein